MTTLLIDADMAVYRSSVAVEKDVVWHDDDEDHPWHLAMSSMEDAKGVFYELFEELKELAGTDDVMFCFSDKTNFRKDLPGVEYKAHRSSRKPLCYWGLRKYIEARYPCTSWPNLEADDVMGILQTTEGADTVIWSLDKDLKQIPGKHLVDDEIIYRTPEECEFFHMYQTVVGDVADGYAGCPGVGDTRAMKYLGGKLKPVSYQHELLRGKRKGERETRWKDEPSGSLWETVVALYEQQGLTEDDALKQSRLAKILDANHYVNGEIKLWTAKT